MSEPCGKCDLFGCDHDPVTASDAHPPNDGCECPPCPGRGNDGHGLTHCAECCFGTGVEADIDCPVHGDARPPSDTGTTGWHMHPGRAAYRDDQCARHDDDVNPSRPVIVVDPAEAHEAIVREAETHRPADDWKCACGEDLFGGSAGYSWALFKSHLASRVLAALAGQGQP